MSAHAGSRRACRGLGVGLALAVPLLLALVATAHAQAGAPGDTAAAARPRWTAADSIAGEALLDSLRARRARLEESRPESPGLTTGQKVEAAALVLGSAAGLSSLAYMESGHKWLGGVNIGLGVLGLASDARSGGLSVPARITWAAGFGGLAAWQISEGEDRSEGRLFWTNLAGMTGTIAVTALVEWIATRGRPDAASAPREATRFGARP